jgi:hypothetical protein
MREHKSETALRLMAAGDSCTKVLCKQNTAPRVAAAGGNYSVGR